MGTYAGMYPSGSRRGSATDQRRQRIAEPFDREGAERESPLRPRARPRLRAGTVHARTGKARLESVGIDYIPRAIEAERSQGFDNITYVVGDVTNLQAAGIGTFDFFLDIGCFHGLDAMQRLAEGEGMTALGKPGE